MPYWITDKQADCDGWATVKEEDGMLETITCHSTKQDAVDQMVALSLAEGIDPMGERAAGDFTPPEGVQTAAKRAIKWIDEGYAGAGFTATGRRRAAQLASGEAVSADIVNRMRSYFARHEVDKQATGFNNGEEGFPTPGRVAWDAWGGDAGQTWANSLSEQTRAVGGEKIVICDIDGTLINAGNLVTRVYDYAKAEPGSLYIVTGRPESEREATISELDRLGVTYSRLIMNDGSTADSMEYKKATAEELLQAFDIVKAIENDEATVAAYRDLGIDTIEPKDVPEQNTARDRWMRAAWLIKDKLEGGEARKLGTREMRVNHVEFRAAEDGMSFEGYASVFNSDSEPLPFIERVAPGAFKRSLSTRNRIMLLWNHDHSQPLASTRNGSLSLTEDSTGLKVRATLPDTQLGRDIRTLVQTGVVDSMSFGFSVKKDSWSADGSTRTLQDVTLYEVSLVSAPAYEGTAGTVSVREINPEVLADSLTRLEAGEELDEAQAAALTEVVNKLSPQPEVIDDLDALSVKKAKLNLYLKGN